MALGAIFPIISSMVHVHERSTYIYHCYLIACYHMVVSQMIFLYLHWYPSPKIGTLVPIPKNKYYRAIALSSILGKLLDHILLVNCSQVFETAELQHGFKEKHSTNQCIFVNEVIQYYTNNNSYMKLFKLLLLKNVCPIIARFLFFVGNGVVILHN